MHSITSMTCKSSNIGFAVACFMYNNGSLSQPDQVMTNMFKENTVSVCGKCFLAYNYYHISKTTMVTIMCKL